MLMLRSIALVSMIITSVPCITDRQARQCYQIKCNSNGKLVTEFKCFIWFDQDKGDSISTGHCLLAGTEGDFLVYPEYCRLEAKVADGSWKVVLDFKKKALSQETFSDTIVNENWVIIQTALKNTGYPGTETTLSDLRLNIGKSIRK